MGFATAEFGFGIVPIGASVEYSFGHRFDWYLDDNLHETGKLPELGSAPSSSWFLARLRALDPSIPAESQEQNDGGGFCFDMAVAEGRSVVALFQFQGDMEGVVATGEASDADTAERVLQQLILTLTESANNLAECCYRIIDPDWMMDPDCFVPTPDDNSQNEYGWRYGVYLGADNICEG